MLAPYTLRATGHRSVCLQVGWMVLADYDGYDPIYWPDWIPRSCIIFGDYTEWFCGKHRRGLAAQVESRDQYEYIAAIDNSTQNTTYSARTRGPIRINLYQFGVYWLAGLTLTKYGSRVTEWLRNCLETATNLLTAVASRLINTYHPVSPYRTRSSTSLQELIKYFNINHPMLFELRIISGPTWNTITDMNKPLSYRHALRYAAGCASGGKLCRTHFWGASLIDTR